MDLFILLEQLSKNNWRLEHKDTIHIQNDVLNELTKTFPNVFVKKITSNLCQIKGKVGYDFLIRIKDNNVSIIKDKIADFDDSGLRDIVNKELGRRGYNVDSRLIHVDISIKSKGYVAYYLEIRINWPASDNIIQQLISTKIKKTLLSNEVDVVKTNLYPTHIGFNCYFNIGDKYDGLKDFLEKANNADHYYFENIKSDSEIYFIIEYREKILNIIRSLEEWLANVSEKMDINLTNEVIFQPFMTQYNSTKSLCITWYIHIN